MDKIKRKLSKKQATEVAKRARTGSSGIVDKNMELDQYLLDAIDELGRDEIASSLGLSGPKEVVQRDIITVAVASHLPDIVESLLSIGFIRTQAHEIARPRSLDRETWDCLDEAAKLVGISAISLLRATLVRLAQAGVESIDLTKCSAAIANLQKFCDTKTEKEESQL